MTKIYLVESRIGTPSIGWRLLAERVPHNISEFTVGLASSGDGCQFPLNNLHGHDGHAAGSGADYVNRVVASVKEAASKMKWGEGYTIPTGYTIHEIEVK